MTMITMMTLMVMIKFKKPGFDDYKYNIIDQYQQYKPVMFQIMQYGDTFCTFPKCYSSYNMHH